MSLDLISCFISFFHSNFRYFFFQNEKAQLHTHRSTMLRLNASVHSWLTRMDRRKQSENAAAMTAAVQGVDANQTEDLVRKETSTDTNGLNDEEFHKQLKNEVGNMYSVWEEADRRYVGDGWNYFNLL